MEGEKTFCQGCKQRIPKPSLFLKITGTKIYEFEEGYYCENCAKVKVNKERKK